MHLLMFFVYTAFVYLEFWNVEEFGSFRPVYLMLAFAAFSLAISLTAGVFILLLRFEKIRKWIMVLTGVVYTAILAGFILTNMDYIWSRYHSTTWVFSALGLLLWQLIPFYVQEEILVDL